MKALSDDCSNLPLRAKIASVGKESLRRSRRKEGDIDGALDESSGAAGPVDDW